MYVSPITLTEEFVNDVMKGVEGDIFRAVMKVNIKVDRDELLKALEYDRKQYESGYDDGYRRGFIDGYEKRMEELKDDVQKL